MMFLRKNKELTKPSTYKRIISLIETAQTTDELINKYFNVLREVDLMKSRDKSEIESRYLKKKEKLNKTKGNQNG